MTHSPVFSQPFNRPRTVHSFNSHPREEAERIRDSHCYQTARGLGAQTYELFACVCSESWDSLHRSHRRDTPCAFDQRERRRDLPPDLLTSPLARCHRGNPPNEILTIHPLKFRESVASERLFI